MPMIMHDSRQIQTSQLPFLGIGPCAERKRYAFPGDLNFFICRSFCRVG